MKLKWKISIAGVLLVVLTAVLFTRCMTPVFRNCVAEITLVKNKIVKHKAICPTRLLSVDLNQRTIELEVQFPDHNWQRYRGKENTRIEDLGYYVGKVDNENEVEISVNYPDNGWGFKYW